MKTFIDINSVFMVRSDGNLKDIYEYIYLYNLFI